MSRKRPLDTRRFILEDRERGRTGFSNRRDFFLKLSDEEALEMMRKSRKNEEHWREIKNRMKNKRLLNGGRRTNPNERGARRSLTPPTPTISQLYDDDNDDDDDDDDFYNDGDFRLGNDTPYFDNGSFWGEAEVQDDLEYNDYSDEERSRLWNEYLLNRDTWEAIRMSQNDTGEVSEFGRVINSAISEFESESDIAREYIDPNFEGDGIPTFKIYNAIEIRKYYGRDPTYFHTFESNLKEILSNLRINNMDPMFRESDYGLGEKLKIICANEVHYQLMKHGVNHRACKIITNEVSEGHDPTQRELFDYDGLRDFIITITHRNQVALDGINRIIKNIRQRFQAVVTTDYNGHYISRYNYH